MKVKLRTLLLAAIVLTLVALPTVALAASGQPVMAAGSTVFAAAGDTGIGHWPPPPCPPHHAPHYPPYYPPPPPPHCGAPCPPPPPPPPPVYHPTPTPAPGQPVGATIGVQLMTKVIGDPRSPTIYAYTNEGWLYRSNANGTVWYMVVTNPAVSDFLMSASDPNILYSGAGPNCGSSTATIAPMYKSEDSGETWTELPAGLGLKPMLIDPSSADMLFAADCTTLYLSPDGGQTWTPKPDAPADNIWQTYTLADLAAGAQWDAIYGVGNDAQGVGIVTFTGDQGATFSDITDPNQAPQGASAVLPSLADSGKLWVASAKGVWSSADYGVNWSLSQAGLEYLIKTNTEFNDLAYGQNGSLYLATDKGLYIQKEPDGAWKLPDKGDVNFGAENMTSLLITQSNPTRLWINSEPLDDDEHPMVYTLRVK